MINDIINKFQSSDSERNLKFLLMVVDFLSLTTLLINFSLSEKVHLFQ